MEVMHTVTGGNGLHLTSLSAFQAHLSGHGDSEWREAYSGETFAKEVMAVCSDAASREKPVVVAHSFGGFVGLETAHHYGDQLRGVVFADFTVAPRAQYVEWGNQRPSVEPQDPRFMKIVTLLLGVID